MTMKDQVSGAVEAFFKQVDDGLLSHIEKQSLPFVGALEDAPGVSDALAAYTSIKEALLAAIAKVPDEPTEQDAADAIVQAIKDLGIEGVDAKATPDAGVTLILAREESFSAAPGGDYKLDGGIGSFLGVSAALGARVDAAVAAELTIAKDGKVTLADLGKPEIAVALTGDLSFAALAKLGIVDVSVKDAHPVDPAMPDDPAAHELLVNLGVDIRQDDAGVFSQDADFAAKGRLDLAFESRADEDLPFQVLPDLSGRLVISLDADEKGLGTPGIAFDDVTVDLGSYLRLVAKAAGKVGDVFDAAPLGTLVDVATAPIPVIDGVNSKIGLGLDKVAGDGKVTLADLVVYAREDLRDTIEPWYKVVAIIDILRGLGKIDGDVKINLGSGKVVDGTGSFDSLDFLDQLRAALKSLAGLDDKTVAYLTDFDSKAMSAKIAETFAAEEASGGGFRFGLLEDPGKVIDLLLGKDNVSLVEYDVPALTFEQSFSKFFPIIGPLGVQIGGTVGAQIDFDLGYDSRGIANGKFFDGFYISTGKDDPDTLPNLSDYPFQPIGQVTTELRGAAGIGYGGGSFTVGASFLFGIYAYLNGDGDGRYRLNGEGIDCIFDPIAGVATVEANARLEIDFAFFTYSKNFPIASTTLAQFETFVCPHPDFEVTTPDAPGLATRPGTGDVRLNVGPAEGSRLVPDGEGAGATLRPVKMADDPGTPDRSEVDDEAYLVALARDTTQGGIAGGGETTTLVDGKLDIHAFGFTQRIVAGRIVGDFGAGNDALIIQADVVQDSDVSGGDGDDNLVGGGGRDTFRGDAGNDVLSGGDGDDFLYGGKDADQLSGGRGGDVIDGGEGSDTVDYSAANEASGIGVTIVVSKDGKATSSGGEADGDQLSNIENVIGTAFKDDIRATTMTQSVYLEGGAGNDFLSGGAGDDILMGGEGADTLVGMGGRNGTSYIASWAGVDIDLNRIVQQGGDAQGDILIGIQAVQGTTFVDHMVGDGAANRFDTGDGADRIEGGAGKDEILAGSGDDVVLALGDGDVLDGGAGIDTLSYEKAAAAVVVNLRRAAKEDGSPDPAAAPDTIAMVEPAGENGKGGISTFENLVGSRFDDTLTGDNQANRIEGGAGKDSLAGAGGDDVLVGGAGADALAGGAGLDTADYATSLGAVNVDLDGTGTGNDAQGDTYLSVENLRGSIFGDVLRGTDGLLLGFGTPDVRIIGADNIIDPNISGLAVTDTVDGGNGIDTLRVDYSTVQADVGRGVEGAFTLGKTTGKLVHYDATGTGTLDTVDFVNIERLDFVGTRFADRIFAGNGDDRLVGGAGDDQLFAGLGDDQVFGAQGDDDVAWGIQLSEPDPRDARPVFYLNGGSGTDTLSLDLTGITEDVTVRGGGGEGDSVAYYNLRLSTGAAATRFEKLSLIVTDAGDDRITQAGRVDNDFSSGDGNDVIESGLGRDTIDGGLQTDGLSSTYTFDDDGLRVYDVEDIDRFRNADGDTLVLDYSTLEAGRRVVSATYQVKAFSLDGRSAAGAPMPVAVNATTGRYVTLDTATYGETGLPRPTPQDSPDDVQFENIERLQVTGSAGNDIIAGTDNAVNPGYLAGATQEAGDDFLFGAAGDDYLYGKGGDDYLEGGDGDDVLVGSSLSTAGPRAPDLLYDRNERDVLAGGDGADRFVLGVSGGALYTRATASDDRNHALIGDFSAAGGDVIQLYGSARQYQLNIVDGSTEIYLLGGRQPELIGIVRNVTGLDLFGSAFRYVDAATDDPSDPPVASGTGAGMRLAPAALERTASETDVPAVAEEQASFAVTQNAAPAALKAVLDGTSGATGTAVTLSGSAEAFGTFSDDPFGLGKGIILSTGRVTDLPGSNQVQNSGTMVTSVPVGFEFIGRTGNNDIYRADLSHLGVEINSIRLADSNSRSGGGTGDVSGFDLGAVALSTTLVTKAMIDESGGTLDLDDAAVLPRIQAFDFAADTITYLPGTQRTSGDGLDESANLWGAINGTTVNQAGARLDRFDPAGGVGPGNGLGSITLGDGGSIAFDLNQTVSTKQPLYLYIAEAGGSGEKVLPVIQVSADGVAPSGDLSTDLGAQGPGGDDTMLTYRFTPRAGDTAFSFDAVFFTEELPEYDGTQLSDLYSIKLNGIDIGRLSNGTNLSLKSLVYSGSGDLVANTPGEGPLADQVRADAYTKTLTIAGVLRPGQENVLTIEVKDGRDAFLDSGLLIKDGSIRTFVRPDIEIRQPSGGAQAGPGERTSFTIALPEGATPDAPVTVVATPSGNLDLGRGAGQAVTVTFDPAGPGTRTIDATVVAGADPDVDGRIDYDVSSRDPDYDGRDIASSYVDVVPPAASGDPFLLFERLAGDVAPGFTAGNDVLDVSGRPGPTTLHVAGLDTGRDTLKGFGTSDILVTDERIADSNNDGLITFGKNGVLDFDGPDKGLDTLRFAGGPKSLRYIGTDDAGHFAYADAGTRVKGWKEGLLGDTLLSGDAKDKKADTFLFDTALDVNWGADVLRLFGAKDRLVTTTALFDADADGKIVLGAGGRLALNGNGALDASHAGDVSATAPFGLVTLTGIDGQAVSALELQKVISQNGHTYYVYGLD